MRIGSNSPFEVFSQEEEEEMGSSGYYRETPWDLQFNADPLFQSSYGADDMDCYMGADGEMVCGEKPKTEEMPKVCPQGKVGVPPFCYVPPAPPQPPPIPYQPPQQQQSKEQASAVNDVLPIVIIGLGTVALIAYALSEK